VVCADDPKSELSREVDFRYESALLHDADAIYTAFSFHPVAVPLSVFDLTLPLPSIVISDSA
jgi:hypothetical protein